MSSAFLFVYAVVALLLTGNAIRRPSPPSSRFPALWLPAVFVAEIPWFWFLLRIVVGGGFAAFGAHQLPIGRLGLLILAVAQVLQLELVRRARASARDVGSGRAAAAWWERVTGWPYRVPEGIERTTEIEYGNGLMLLHGDKKEDEAAGAYEKAAKLKPKDAMEKLDVEFAKAQLED